MQAVEGATDASQCVANAARRLPAGSVAAIVICVLLADVVHASFFVRRNVIRVAHSKGWIVASIILGPLVWFIWWYHHRAAGPLPMREPLISHELLQKESRSVDSSVVVPLHSVPAPAFPLRSGLSVEGKGFCAVTQPLSLRAGGASATKPGSTSATFQPSAHQAIQVQNLDEPSEDMTDQYALPSPHSTHVHVHALQPCCWFALHLLSHAGVWRRYFTLEIREIPYLLSTASRDTSLFYQ